ncbi:beta-hexosaminidase, partial [Kipferlia bialata]
NINNIPFDPTMDETYTVLQSVLSDSRTIFTDDYIHMGGDEVVTGCWNEMPEIQ